MEYGNVAIMGASTTQLSSLDITQNVNVVTDLCHVFYVPLQSHHYATAVGLLLKLLDRSSRLATSTQPYLLADSYYSL